MDISKKVSENWHFVRVAKKITSSSSLIKHVLEGRLHGCAIGCPGHMGHVYFVVGTVTAHGRSTRGLCLLQILG